MTKTLQEHDAAVKAAGRAATDAWYSTTTDATTPFSLRDLSVLHYANGFTLWKYKTTKIDAVLTPDYFNDIADTITNGDHIYVAGTDGGMLLRGFFSPVAKGVIVEKLARFNY